MYPDKKDQNLFARYLDLKNILILTIFIALFISVFYVVFSESNLLAMEQLSNIATIATKLFVMALVSGVFGMALVEIWKNIGNGKGNFHSSELLRECPMLYKQWEPPLDVPLEQLMASFATEMENALSNPIQNAEIFLSLIKKEDKAYKEPKDDKQENTGTDCTPDPVDIETALAVLKKLDHEELTEANEHTKMKALVVLRQSAERFLDKLQHRLSAKWKKTVRVYAMYTSGMIGSSVLVLTENNIFIIIAVGFTTALIGGFFSWVSRDIVAAIQKLRG